MKKNINYLLATLLVLVTATGCEDKEYTLGDLSAPSDLVITTEIAGQDAAHPNGDGSGNVKITVTGKNVLSCKVDFDASDAVDLVYLPTGTITKKIYEARIEHLPHNGCCLRQRRFFFKYY